MSPTAPGAATKRKPPARLAVEEYDIHIAVGKFTIHNEEGFSEQQTFVARVGDDLIFTRTGSQAAFVEDVAGALDIAGNRGARKPTWRHAYNRTEPDFDLKIRAAVFQKIVFHLSADEQSLGTRKGTLAAQGRSDVVFTASCGQKFRIPRRIVEAIAAEFAQ